MKNTVVLKDRVMLINGDKWTVVDVAPAAPLAEMVAVILEQEGFPVIVRGTDVFSHLGASEMGATYVLVPEKDAARALQLIAETVTDFEGEEAEKLLEEMGKEES
jgi:Putative prokaryotic signal transducing protein